MDSLPRQGFFQEKLSFFWWEIVFNFFSHLGWVNFRLWQKTFNRLSKLCFYLSRVMLQVKTFTGNTKQFNKISVIERNLYQKFGEKKGFSAWNYQHSSGNWTLRFRRDFLRKIMFSEKKSVENIFCTSTRFLSSFVEFVRHVYQNCVPVSRWKIWGNFFFSNKNFFTSYFQQSSGKLSYFALNLQSKVKSAFQVSRGFFPGDFRFW